MVKAAVMRRCAYQPCGIEFPATANRQLYCSPEHSQQARDAKRRHGHCAQCQKPLGCNTARRFCDKACRWSYQQERRGKRGKRVVEPVAVLLPAGCNPHPVRLRISELPIEYGEVARKLYCRRYERCLSYAVSKKWSGFGCQGCDVDEPLPATPGHNPKGGNWSW